MIAFCFYTLVFLSLLPEIYLGEFFMRIMRYANSMLIKLFNFSKKYFFAIFALSVIFTLSSVWWTSNMHHYQDTKANIQLGFPLNFYSQDHSQEDI